jgi:CheY-like chemotaxis protein
MNTTTQTQRLTVLVVDDDENNLRILRLDLEDKYDIILARNGLEAWETLEKNAERIKIILLDRMMPKINGLEFMAKLRANEEYFRIPVIMQTAAAAPEQVAEGIRAGVYYYLTKPYEKDVMLSLVDAAAEDYANYSQLRYDVREFRSKLYLVKNSSFELHTLEEARYLATFLAQFYPQPEYVIFGISEMLINAIEHGNLGITYDEKSELNRNATWKEEVERRLKLPENARKRVFVDYAKRDDLITLLIRDEGEGFDWNDYMEISPERVTHNHGRGIAISARSCFDKIEYHGRGNEVLCVVKR